MLKSSPFKSLSILNVASFVLIGVFSASIISSLLLLGWLAWRQLLHPILYLDSFNLAQLGDKGILPYLFNPNNEHRIVFAKLNALVEYRLLGIPFTSTALAQHLAIILLSIGLLALICKSSFANRKVRLLTWLSCSLLLLIPWQYENLPWEFQTPWLLMNALLLATTLALAEWPTSNKRGQRLIVAYISLQPWLAIFDSGQGFALILATVLTLLIASSNLIKIYISSSALAVLVYVLLPRPLNKPGDYGFDIDFFAQLIQGGTWHGLMPLVLILLLVSLRYFLEFRLLNHQKLVALLLPGIFAVLFVLMVTISRANVAWGSPNDSRYSTHTLMLAISALLIATLFIEKQKNLILVPALAVLLTTTLSFPQSITGGEMMYDKAWKHIIKVRKTREEAFACNLDQTFLSQNRLLTGTPCEKICWDDVAYRYFSGQYGMVPVGQHQRDMNDSKNLLTPSLKPVYSYSIDHKRLDSASLRIKGWGFDPAHPYQRLFLIARYSDGAGQFYAVQDRRDDVMQRHSSRRESTGFAVNIPLRNASGSELLSISLAGRSGLQTIWSPDVKS